ncbi:DNA topoisomerase small subunit [Salmonella phage SEA1]|nr:DNA topoisomerase small subunit [Salmonella phage SEA1]
MSKGSEQKWYYNAAEYEAEKDKLTGWKLRYIKGLGSLEEDEYERVIQKPVYDVVSLPPNWKELFEMVMGNDAAPRKVWMSE